MFISDYKRQMKYMYTIEDIYALPDGERAELIDGQMYKISHPNRIHQRIIVELLTAINNHIKANDDFCEVFASPFAVFLNANDKTYVEPDISVICDKGKLIEKGCNGAPDWIIEIVSPGSRHMDYEIKKELYSDAGVREYWIVDPTKNRIIVYDFANGNENEYTLSDKVRVCIYKDLEIDFSEF